MPPGIANALQEKLYFLLQKYPNLRHDQHIEIASGAAELIEQGLRYSPGDF